MFISKRKLIEQTMNEHDAFELCEQLGILSKSPQRCSKCNIGTLKPERGKNRKGLDLRFRCNNRRGCRNSKSIYKDTILHKAGIKISSFLNLLWAYCEHDLTKKAANEANVSEPTVIKWFKTFQQILLNSNESDKIGSNEEIIELDETHLYTRKYFVGRILKSEKWWLFGAISRSTGKINLKMTRTRDALNCCNFVRSSVNEGSIVITDYWRGYNKLSQIGYQHEKVNHSINFVDQERTWIHTQRIERLWRSIKEFIPKNTRFLDYERKIREFIIWKNFDIKKPNEKFLFMCYLIETTNDFN